jgi:hypothetical protein
VNRRRDGEPTQKRLCHETLVRARIVGRDAALVAEPERRTSPVGQRTGGQLVGAPRRRSSGKGNGTAGAGDLGEQCSSGSSRVFRPSNDDELDVHDPIVSQ